MSRQYCHCLADIARDIARYWPADMEHAISKLSCFSLPYSTILLIALFPDPCSTCSLNLSPSLHPYLGDYRNNLICRWMKSWSMNLSPISYRYMALFPALPFLSQPMESVLPGILFLFLPVYIVIGGSLSVCLLLNKFANITHITKFGSRSYWLYWRN